jgi:hypothetical protein
VQEIHDKEVVEVLPYLGHFFQECILLNILGGFNMIKLILHTRVGTIDVMVCSEDSDSSVMTTTVRGN